ncbi:MAG TPA: hypothetical protein VGG28_22055 [Kofleriaceae bacterium]|jgi:hypothetical protein
MKRLWLVVLVGCQTGAVSTPDAELELTSCAIEGPPIVTTCTVAADCVLLVHLECCGAIVLGIAASDGSAAQAEEATYDRCEEAQCGARGCASPTKAEDGSVPSGSQTIVATCVDGACSSTVE